MPEITRELVNEVVENSNVDDKISVYGNYNLVYVLSGRVHASKYSYQFPIGNVYPPIMDEYWKDLEAEQPKLLVVASELDGRANDFIVNNQYSLIWMSEDEHYSIYKK